MKDERYWLNIAQIAVNKGDSFAYSFAVYKLKEMGFSIQVDLRVPPESIEYTDYMEK